jgi:hypothetical protein
LDLTMRHLAASTHPILVGPWRSEVGFEVLYWIPYLTALRKRYGISRDRIIALGRGGSAAWYDAAGTADLYEHLPVGVVRTLSLQSAQQTGSIKQNTAQDWECHVCALTATSLGIAKYHTLSPSLMYRQLAPFWEGRQPLSWLDGKLLQPLKMAAPPLPAGVVLPKRFIAMRWYARPTWPLHEALTLWTRTFVEAVASKIPVVMIESGYQADDHADIHLGPIPNVTRLSDLAPMMTPLNNLAIQSSVIAKASAYVGTYGGMAQGAMRWGVPTVALYRTFEQTAPAHLLLTQSISLQSGVPFVVGTPDHLDRLLPLITTRTMVPAGSTGVMEIEAVGI